MGRPTIRVALLAVTLLLLASKAQAQVRGHINACNITSEPIAFGTFTGDRIDTVGGITLICDGAGTNNPVVVALSEGSSNSFLGRFLLLAGSGGGPGRELTYNLYIDPGRTLIWGSGAGETRVQTAMLDFQGGRPDTVRFPMYARINRQQVPRPGPYMDQIIVAVTF